LQREAPDTDPAKQRGQVPPPEPAKPTATHAADDRTARLPSS